MNYILETTALGQAICLAVAFILPSFLAKDDAIEIELNGSLNTLGKKWHFNSATTRAIVFAALIITSLLPAVVMAGIWFESLLVALAYALVSVSWHWFVFDRKLNKLRGLDVEYVGENSEADLFLHNYAAHEVKRLKIQFVAIALLGYICSASLLFYSFI